MFGLLVICLLSTITPHQTDGVQRIKTRMLNEPDYQRQERFYDTYKRDADYTRELERINRASYSIEENDRASYSSEESKRASYSAEDTSKGGYRAKENEDRSSGSRGDQDDYDGQESRRLFEWFSRLFHSTTPRTIQTTVSTTESSYQRELKERIFLRALHRNLTDLLFKLSEVQKQVSFVMTQKESYAILTRGKPQIVGVNKPFFYHDRVKRDTADVVKEETTKRPFVEVTVNNVNESEAHVNETECVDNATSGRRFGSAVTPTEVKNKLLLYLQESFQEIKAKIMSLKNLKQAFSENVSFKIGYILANIDTLDVSMMNLKNDMEKNKTLWEDKKILDLYDTLKVSNQAVSGLIESLKVYLDKLSRQPQEPPGNNLS